MSNAIVPNPLAPKKTVFVAAPMHVRDLSLWDGPFDTIEQAKESAARMCLRHGWSACSVFQLVGTVTKPLPEMTWNEVPSG